MRARSWYPPGEPLPKRPYRDTALVFAGMSVVIVFAAWLTGGDLANALAIAAVFFVAATAWGWHRLRGRLRAEQARKAEEARSRP